MKVSNCLNCENCSNRNNCTNSTKNKFTCLNYKSNSDAQFKEDVLNLLAAYVDEYRKKYNEAYTLFEKEYNKRIKVSNIKNTEEYLDHLRSIMRINEDSFNVLFCHFAQDLGIMKDVEALAEEKGFID